MSEQADAAEVTDFEPLRQSLRWHFACHAEEPEKSYASLGITNAETIVTRMLAAAEARAWDEAELLAYNAWNELDGLQRNPFDGRTREGRAWSDGARAVFHALRDRNPYRAAQVAPSRVPSEES